MAKKDKSEVQAAPEPAPTPAAEFPSHKEVTLQGFLIKLPMVVRPGHVLSYDEALFHSAARVQFAANAFGDRAKALKEGLPEKKDKSGAIIQEARPPVTPEEMQAEAEAFFAEYEWTPRGPAEQIDPVQREAWNLARKEIDLALRADGKKGVTGMQRSFIDPYIQQHLDNNRDRFIQQAEANLAAARNVVSNEVLSALSAQLDKKPAEASAA